VALALTPLELETLPEPVRRVVAADAPDAVRLLAARGAAPLAPRDLVTALYQLGAPWLVESPGEVAMAARATAAGMPDGVLKGALASDLDGRVLDWFAHQLAARPQPIQVVLFNKATADETFAFLAQIGREGELSVIARNEQRLLRHPPIIAALYLNPKTPMSVASRAVELAIRNGVAVEGIPGFEDVKASLIAEAGKGSASGADDETAKQACEPDQAPAEAAEPAADAPVQGPEPAEEDPEKATSIGKMSMSAKLRLAMVGNAFSRAVLIRDSNRVIQMATIRSPAINDNEVIRYAGNRGLSEDVIRYIASQRHFVRLYAVKLSLVNNPKCPLQTSMGLLQHLNPRDLKVVARSKGVPSALTKAAQGLLSKRESR
jgi:hypothetical protein